MTTVVLAYTVEVDDSIIDGDGNVIGSEHWHPAATIKPLNRKCGTEYEPGQRVAVEHAIQNYHMGYFPVSQQLRDKLRVTLRTSRIS